MFGLFAFLAVFAGLSCISASSKLVIDHDGGADDAMAIFLALLYEKHFDGPTVVALTTTHGNVDEPQAFVNTQRVLNIAQRRDVPIYRGSNFSLVITKPTDHFFGIDGLGDMPNVEYEPIEAQEKHAVIALIELSKVYEGDLVVISLGALTNIALAIRLDPLFVSRLSHLYVAAGAGNFKTGTQQHTEFNAVMDVEGYYVVAQNSFPEKVTSIFLDTLDPITVEWRRKVLGAIDTPIMRAQNKFETVSGGIKKTWTFLDPHAVAMALNSSLVKSYGCDNNSIVLCGNDRGINTNILTDCKDSNVKVAFPAKKDNMKDFLYEVFSVQGQ